MKKQLKDLNLEIPQIDLLESRKLFGGNGGYGDLDDYDIDGGWLNEIEVKPSNQDDYDPYKDGDRPDYEEDDDDFENEHHDSDDDRDQSRGDDKDDKERPTVPNGECPIGAIEQAMREAGMNVEDGKVKEYFDTHFEKEGEKGYKMNSDDFYKACDEFLDGERSTHNGHLGGAIENGDIGVARVDFDGDGDMEHMVVLLDAEYNYETGKYEFDYWDPVTGKEGHIDDDSKIGEAWISTHV